MILYLIYAYICKAQFLDLNIFSLIFTLAIYKSLICTNIFRKVQKFYKKSQKLKSLIKKNLVISCNMPYLVVNGHQNIFNILKDDPAWLNLDIKFPQTWAFWSPTFVYNFNPNSLVSSCIMIVRINVLTQINVMYTCLHQK